MRTEVSLKTRIKDQCALAGYDYEYLYRFGKKLLKLYRDVSRNNTLDAEDILEDICSESYESDISNTIIIRKALVTNSTPSTTCTINMIAKFIEPFYETFMKQSERMPPNIHKARGKNNNIFIGKLFTERENQFSLLLRPKCTKT